MNTLPSDKYLPLEAAADFLHISVERLETLKERGLLKFYGKKDTEERFCKLSELKAITWANIMDTIHGPLGDEDSEEGRMFDFETGGGDGKLALLY